MKHFWKKNEKLFEVLKCMLVAYVLTGVMILILALLLFKFSLPAKVIGAGITMIYIISSLIGGLMVGKKMQVRKFVWGLILGSAYFGVLLLVSLVAGGGAGNVSANLFLTYALCAGSGMLGGMLG